MHFKTWLDFQKFSFAVMHSSRYVHSDDVTAFLDALFQSSDSRHRRITKMGYVWRAQSGGATVEREDEMGEKWEETLPHKADRMKPPHNSAFEGRVNPKGIPCLYVSNERDTAMAEVRPWIGGTISLGQFRLNRELKLIDFSVGHDTKVEFLFDDEPTEKVDENIWAQVDRAFSAPIESTHSTAEYVPTQVIAEFFRSKGFDGVVYKSNLGKGLNFALFDLNAATLVTCSLVNVEDICFKFSPLERTYKVTA